MTMANYVEIMTTKQNHAASNPEPYLKLMEYGAEVFLVDEYTSMVYMQVTPDASAGIPPASGRVSGSHRSEIA